MQAGRSRSAGNVRVRSESNGRVPGAFGCLLRSGVLQLDPAAASLLSGDPGRELVTRELRGAAAELLHAPPGTAVAHTFETRLAIYTARLSRVAAGLFGSDVAVLISLERENGDHAVLDCLQTNFRLTRREAEVALLLIGRQGNAEIAESLFISPHTVRHHVERILQKLGVNSRRQARALLLCEIES